MITWLKNAWTLILVSGGIHWLEAISQGFTQDTASRWGEWLWGKMWEQSAIFRHNHSPHLSLGTLGMKVVYRLVCLLIKEMNIHWLECNRRTRCSFRVDSVSSLLLAAKPSSLRFYILIKRLLFFSAAVGTWQESRRQIWQDSCGETWMSFIVLFWPFRIDPRRSRQAGTWVVWQPESSAAEVSPPLLLHVFFQGTVEDEYEQTWKKKENQF